MLGVSNVYNIQEIRVVPFKASGMFLKRLQEAILRRGEKLLSTLSPLFFYDGARNIC
jgi:hypothetical protein